MNQDEHVHSLGAMIACLHRHNLRYLSQELEIYGIGGGQFRFLLALYHVDGIRPEELSRMLMVNRATATRALKRLEEAGYVQRAPDPKDRRALVVNLTEEGHRMHRFIRQLSQKRSESMLAGFSEEEKTLFRNLLERAISNCVRACK
ncbi:MarR family winged helix-turn-helix transcriptional regulator [Methanohalophilus profundi]|uniref:MarR family winged helix-turn-helix transcriptional regulator n=1 Tax=Methanohalophilus profundi TaxID=2138083 RepID=UPI00101BC470|nr:MarR family transcriptional regulator [Methanohalophilus profundi]